VDFGSKHLFKITPVSRVGNIWIKRDDCFEMFGVNGGKVRACLALARHSTLGLVSAAARQSPQSIIVAAIAAGLGLPCKIHTASGAITEELRRAQLLRAEIIFHQPGYNSVISRRALDDACKFGWTLVPFGMESSEAVYLTAQQMLNIPSTAKRLVVPVGSGMTLAGILNFLQKDRRKLPVIGVVVGADPTRRLDRWGPPGWRSMVELRGSRLSYKCQLTETRIGNVSLDPIYEAKCLSHLRGGDCLWIVGNRNQ
jgi:1-aminocyclopropane-1-carboxylate deaminase/D-cysteine desulfhydrase-like pyridoxal-dependent ACC family enzyme